MSTIDVGRLLEELAQKRAQREAASTTTAFNLIAFVENDADLASLIHGRVAQIEVRNPSRAIFLMCDDREAEVGMERVQIAVRDLAAPQLRSIVHDLLVPNVRTVLLWAGSSIADPRFTALADLAGVVILFTSRTAGSETKTLADIVALQGGPIEAKIRDLAFLRLMPWQDLVAQFFDDEALLPQIEHLCEVEVCSGTVTEAYYLIGWLASALGWQPCGQHEFCNASGGNIAVKIRTEGAPRRIHSVRLVSAAATFEAVVQKGSDDTVCLSVEGQDARPSRCAPMHDVDMVSLIERAMFVPRDQTTYAETVNMVGRLLQHLS